MSPGSASLRGGLLYTVPFACWFLVAIAGADSGPEVSRTVADGFRVLVLIQAVAAVWLFPALHSGRWRDDTVAVLAFLAVPWPLLTIATLAGDMHWSIPCASQAALAVFTLALMWAGRPSRRARPALLQRLSPAAVQLTGFGLVLVAGGPWLQWAGTA